MESWVLKGDRYSFLCSVPHSFNQDLDGPNCVEIFDITSIPSPSGISETTCLCDIFGDDCESPHLSNSPTATSFLAFEMDEHFPAEDVNGSSRPSHTAHDSKHLSNASDTLEDLKDRATPNHTKDSILFETREPLLQDCLTLSKSKTNVASGSSLYVPTKIYEWSQTENQQVFHLSPCVSPAQGENTYSSDQQQLSTSQSAFGYCSVIPSQTDNSDLAQTRKPQETHFVQDSLPDKDENMNSSDQQKLMTKNEFRYDNIKETVSTQGIITPDLLSENRGNTIQNDTVSSELKENNLKPEVITPSVLPENGDITEQTDTTLYEPCKMESSHDIITPDTLTENRGITEHADTTASVLRATDLVQDIITADLLSENKDITGQSDIMSGITDINSKQNIITPDLLPENSGITEQNKVLSYDLRATNLTQENVQPEEQEISFSENQEHAVIYKSSPKSSLEVTASVASPMEYIGEDYIVEEEGHISLPYLRTSHSLPIEDTIGVQETVNCDCSVHLNNFSPDDSDFTPLQSYPSTSDVIHDLSEMSLSPEPDYIPSQPEQKGESFLTKPLDVQTAPQAGISDLEDTVPLPTFGFQEPNVFEPHRLTICPKTKEVFSNEHRRFSPCLDTTKGLVSPETSDLCSTPAYSMAALSSEPSVIIHSPLGFTLSPSPAPKEMVDSGSVSSSNTNRCITTESRSLSRQNVFNCEYIPELKSASCSPETGDILSQKSMPAQNKVLAQAPDVERKRFAESSISTTSDEIKNSGLLNSNLLETQGSLPGMSSKDTASPDVEGVRCPESLTLITDDVTSSPFSNDSLTQGGISRSQSTSHILRDIVSTDVKENISSNVCRLMSSPQSASLSATENIHLATTFSSSLPSSLNLLGDKSFSPKIRAQISPDICRNRLPLEHRDNHTSATVSEKVDFPSPADEVKAENIDSSEPCKNCTSALDKGTGIVSAPCSQIQKIGNSAAELSVAKSPLLPNQIQMEERNNDSMSDFRQGNDKVSGAAILERQSAGEKQLHHMSVRPGKGPSILHSNHDSKYEEKSCRNKGWSRERVIQEEHPLQKGVDNLTEGGYRGEQVALSFSTRNRKGSAKHSPAPLSREPKSGIPACYFQSPLATRQKQSLRRAQVSQKENKSHTKRIQSTRRNHSDPGRLPSECISKTSNMGTEFDEMNFFTDLAQKDYLDVYKSSHGSSTNVSQPSTVDSPGASTWISYADLQNLSFHENEGLLCHTSTFLPHDLMEPEKSFGTGSFECVDVVVESKQEARKGKRMVPKRQIQLKKYNFDELTSVENLGNVMDSATTLGCSRDTLYDQHSTPVSVQDLFQDEPEIQDDKNMLQKFASVDETLIKTKMASSIIKSVLSRKMDNATKESSRNENSTDDKRKHPTPTFAAESVNTDMNSVSSSIPFECSFPSEDFNGKEERSPHIQKSCCRPKVPPKPSLKANCIPPNSNPGDVALQEKTAARAQMRPTMTSPFEIKTTKKQIIENNDKDANNVENRFNSDSASGNVRTTNSTVNQSVRKQRRMTNKETDYMLTMKTHKQQADSKIFLSKTSKITLKPCISKEISNSPVKASSSPDAEISKDLRRESHLEDKPDEDNKLETKVDTAYEEDNGKNNEKTVLHKVTDIRKMVKNTYNLSFKTSNTTPHEEDSIIQKQKQMQHPHPLYIECKAISLEKKQSACNKTTNLPVETHTSDKLKPLQVDSEIRGYIGITEVPANSSSKPSELMLKAQEKQENATNVQVSEVDLSVESHKGNGGLPTSSDNSEQSTKLEIPPMPSSKEVSTLVFLPDATAKALQNPSNSASPDGKTVSSSHSVSMLLKEKGMQADIGVCDVLNEGAGAKCKHVNKLEVPLQTFAPEGSTNEPQKVKKEAVLVGVQNIPTDSSQQTSQGNVLVSSSLKSTEVKKHTQEGENQIQGASLQLSNEPEKIHYTSMTNISAQPSSSSKAEVKSFTNNTKDQEMAVTTTSTTSKEIELPIQVRSISSDRTKAYVLPKHDFKPPFAEIAAESTDLPKTDVKSRPSFLKQQTDLERDVKAEMSATLIHNEQSTEAAKAMLHNAKTLAVSTVSSHKPQIIPFTTVSSSATASTNRQGISLISRQSPGHQKQQNMTIIKEQVMSGSSCASNDQALPKVSQGNISIKSAIRASSINQLHTEHFHSHASDDPPSYDERESFSPLILSDLAPRSLNRYHHTNKHSPCTCTACSHTHFGQPCHGSQNQTSPSLHLPGQLLRYPGAPPQAHVRPHQCRPDGQPLSYQSVSPKTTVPLAPAMLQPQHHLPTCPVPGIQPCCTEQQQPSTQHMDRRSGNQRSPQAARGALYQEHSRSPNITAVNSRYQVFNPQELPPALGDDYGSDDSGVGGVLYADNISGLGYGQGSRRVLLDPENGKYFYIEVPIQPMRKILFDPEIAQYVEVVISQQSMSPSGLYPPIAAPYPPLHGPGLYASQYLPYAVPPHLQSAQQPLHPVPSVPTTLHQTMGYMGSSTGQMPKSEVKGHLSLDQSYLESMYYIPTGMNASPNSTPSDRYKKLSPNMSTAGGRRTRTALDNPLQM